MLDRVQFEDVFYWRVARNYLGWHMYTTGFYLVGDVLVDCGPPNARRLLSGLFKDLPAKRILITHHHEDHTGNAAFLCRTRGWPVFGHPAGSKALELISHGIPGYRRFAWGVPDACAYDPVEEGMHAGKYWLRAIPTPGHSDDHLCFFVSETGWLFTGDLYLSGHLRYLREDEDIYAMMQSLRTLMQLKPRVLFCNHRGPVADGEAALGKKLAFLERLRDAVLAGMARGVSVNELARQQLRNDWFFRNLSRGEFSARNLIRAFATGDQLRTTGER